jgi:peptide/nickel transport system permease protein
MEETVYDQNIDAKKVRRSSAEFRLIRQRVGNAIITIVVIAYLTIFGLLLAERGREHLPAEPIGAIWQSAESLVDYFTNHPETYYWHRRTFPAFELVGEILSRSAGLLLCSMGAALILGIPLGIAAALSKRKISSAMVLTVSVLGISIPSFLLAMVFWIINIFVARTFATEVLPSAGFGWDLHLVMPALVLAMRPMAQLAQVTSITLKDVMQQDYIRTAYAKGLSWRDVRNRHALRNVLIPIFTTLGTSLRYSLASLIIVELFFDWPGVGLTLFEAIGQGEIFLIVDLILSLGLFFLVVNLALELLFPLLDARIADQNRDESLEEEDSFGGWWRKVFEMFNSWGTDARLNRRLRKEKSELPPLPHFEKRNEASSEKIGPKTNWSWILRNLVTNPALIFGSIILLGLVWLVLFGPGLTSANPQQTNGVMLIEGEVYAPPFAPSSVFPWGSDYVGRDVQALVLHGARQTLTLAFFGMLARLVLGVFLGALAGWSQRGWLDRLVTGAVGVWAAFPFTLFAMILIQALGIQQGMWVFIFAVCVVGWGEIAQFVRGQVIAIKPQLYVESARSVGLRSDQIMIRHIVPNLMNGLIMLAALEMGGVLMLLAELGYLNIFLGGGFQAMIGETGRMQAVVAYYSDVPEWASMIANIRNWWRSYPWMVTYPGIAFFVSILAFNLTGEGLRRFLDENQINLSRLFNKYTFSAGIGLVVILNLVLQGASPISVYRPEALKFNTRNVLRDIQTLSAMEMQGRESGTPGAQKAADYIAQRMEEAGLLPAGEHGTYFQNLVNPRWHLTQLPTLAILNSNTDVETSFRYREDFAELAISTSFGEADGQVVGLAFGEQTGPEGARDPYRMVNSDASGWIVIVRGADLEKVHLGTVNGVLIVADDSFSVQQKDAYPFQPRRFIEIIDTAPVMVITPEVADRLLATGGSSLAEFERMTGSVAPGQFAMTSPGASLRMSLVPEMVEDLTQEFYTHVLGVYPGEGAIAGLDSQVIIVSAYYDGLGVGPDGTVYPGANDNASGVAMLLEMARLLKESAYKPDKTVLFVAWAGGERAERLSVTNIMNARRGGNNLTVTTVIELSGVGYGNGNSIALSEESSYRLVRLFQSVADKLGIPTTTRGRNPHYGHEISFQFGARTALTLAVSWDGSDQLAHTVADTPEIIDPDKVYDIGSVTSLMLFVLARETDY